MAPFELNSPSLTRTQDSTTVYYETGQRDAWLPLTVRVEMPLPPAVELPPKRDPLNCLLEDWFDWSTPNLMARFDRRYDVQHDLGRGGCGGVYLAHHRKLRLDFAVKFVPWALANPEGDHPTFNNDHDVVDPPEELVIMHYLRGHPNIIRAFEWYYDNDGYIIVMEPHGPQWKKAGDRWARTTAVPLQSPDLRASWATHPAAFSEAEVRHIFGRVVRAVHYMESMEVAHRDIKLENILIDDDNAVKIGDFGSAVLEPHDSATTEPVGTKVFWPPEYKQAHKRAGCQLGHVEIWLLGTVLLELVQAPYAPGKKHRAHKPRARGRAQDPDARPPGWSEGAWRACRQLIFACRQPDPANRPTIRTVAANTWLFPDQDGF